MSQRNLITNFNASPFYDDFDEAKKFLRILFRPTYPVQARELTQLQTVLSNQVSRFGSSIYKDGSTVTGGSLTLTDVVSIKLPTGTEFNSGNNKLTSLLTQSNAGTGYQVNDTLKLSYGASDSIVATIGSNNTFTYALVNNITPAGFFSKILTESITVASGAQDAQFEVSQKVTAAVTPAYTLTHTGASSTTFTVDELVTQSTSGATGTVLTSTHAAGSPGTVTTVLIADTVSTTEFDALSAVTGGTSGRSGTPTSVIIDRREESPIFRVLGFTTATTTDLNPTIFGVYETEEEFTNGDEIRFLSSDDVTVSTISLGTLPSGTIQYDSQIISVSEGVFYTNGFFVQIAQQSIPLNKYDRDITARIGYDINEVVVSETDDPTLVDNASGTTNINAPGAHRFKLSLFLTYKADVSTNDDVDNTSDISFYQIGKIESGAIVDRKARAQDSAIVEHVARSINEIQGNFVVKPFILTIKDSAQFTVNPTTHAAGDPIVTVTASVRTLTAADFAGKTLTSNGVPLKILSALQNPAGSTPASSYADIFNLTLQDVSSGTIGGVVPDWLSTAAETSLSVSDPDNFEATLAPGFAYVDGYRYETIAPKKLNLEKTTTSKHVSEAFTFSTNVSMGNFLPLTRKSGTLLAADFAFGTKVLLYATKQGQLPVHDGAIDQAIGTARIKQLVRNDGGGNTWGVDLSGDATGQVKGTLEAYLFDLKFNDGATATDTTTGSVGTALARVTATVNLAAGINQKRINFDVSSVSADTGAHLLGASFVSDGVRYRVTEVAVTLTHAGASTNFAVGQIITGSTSGATGEVIVRTDATNTILFNVTGTFLEDETISNSSGTIVAVAITATGVTYTGAAIKTNINIQTEIADDAVLSFDYDAKNIKSIRFGLTAGTGVANGAIYDVNSSAELTDANGYAATQLQETDKKKLIFPVSEHYLESIKNTTVMYMKTVDVTTDNGGIATPTLSTTNGTESIVQDMSKVIGVATQTVGGAVNYTIGDHLRVGSISSSTITFVQHSGTAISGASLTVRLSFPVIRTSIPSGAFDGDLSIPTDYVFGNIVDTDLFNGATNWVDSAAGQSRMVAGTFIDGAVTSTGVKNWKRIGLTGVTNLVKIYEEASDLGASTANISLTDTAKFTDITSNFDTDFGQYEEYIDQTKIALKAGSPIPDPARDIIVVIDRVKTTTDSGGGKIFYSANSYSTLYSNLIPPVQTSETLDFRRCVDFRPRVKEATSNTSPAIIVDKDLEFSDTATVPFASNINTMTGRVTSYYGRSDKIVISNDLQMKIIQSRPSATSEVPQADERSLVLYDISVPSYTLNKSGITISNVDNAHYTMKDISIMDKRVQELEKSTQLSKVEGAILSAEVNNKSNTNLFKTGVLVDTFRNFDVAFPQHNDFQSAIDVSEGILRPAVDTYALSLDFEENDAASTATEYPDGIVLAPLNTTTPKIVAIKNVVASKRENVNPFNVTVFEGSVKMFPEKDFWKVKDISNVTIPDPSEKEAWEAVTMQGKENPSFEYGEWETKWDGKLVKGGHVFGNFWRGVFQFPKLRYDTQHGTRTRTKTKISYKPEIRETILGHKIVDQTVIRYMRSPPNGKYSGVADIWGATKSNKTVAGIHFAVTTMKPRQNLHVFFDGTKVIDNIRPPIIIKVDNNGTNGAVYGTTIGQAFKGGARPIPASFVGGSIRSAVTLSSPTVTGDDAKCILVLKTKDSKNIYWHVVPPTRGSGLYDITKISDFTGGGSPSSIAIDGTSMTITGMTRAKLKGDFRLRTDPTGAVGGIFMVPNSTFSTGSRTLKITDNAAGAIASSKTFAQKNFESSGMKLTIENQIMQTRVPVKVTENLVESESTSERRTATF